MPTGVSARTLHMDVSTDLEDTRKSFDRKWRNQLGKAEKSGLTVSSGSGVELFDEFALLYEEMLRRKQFSPTSDFPRHRALQKALPADLKMGIVLAHHENRACAGAIYSAIGDTALYLFGATTESGMRTCASYLRPVGGAQGAQGAGRDEIRSPWNQSGSEPRNIPFQTWPCRQAGEGNELPRAGSSFPAFGRQCGRVARREASAECARVAGASSQWHFHAESRIEQCAAVSGALITIWPYPRVGAWGDKSQPLRKYRASIRAETAFLLARREVRRVRNVGFRSRDRPLVLLVSSRTSCLPPAVCTLSRPWTARPSDASVTFCCSVALALWPRPMAAQTVPTGFVDTPVS